MDSGHADNQRLTAASRQKQSQNAAPSLTYGHTRPARGCGSLSRTLAQVGPVSARGPSDTLAQSNRRRARRTEGLGKPRRPGPTCALPLRFLTRDGSFEPSIGAGKINRHDRGAVVIERHGLALGEIK